MKVLVDTSVWSLAFRRSGFSANPYVQELKNLIEEVRVQMAGPIRQELLSGIKDYPQFTLLRDYLRQFGDVVITANDHELAAEFYNLCRGKGVQGSHIDFLLCAVAVNNKLLILTTDKDFLNYKKYIDIELLTPRNC